MTRGRSRKYQTTEHDPQVSRNVRTGSITFRVICPCGERFDERRSYAEAVEDLKLHVEKVKTDGS